MPSVAQEPLPNGVDFLHKDKLGEPMRSGFTAVNGKASPPQAHNTNGIHSTNGMTSDTIHVRPISRNSSEEAQDRKIPVPPKDDWHYPTNGHGHRVVTPSTGSRRDSVDSSGKRKRPSSDEEEDNTYHPQDTAAAQSRRRVDAYDSAPGDDSPSTVSHGLPISIEHPAQRSYQSVDGERGDRTWETCEGAGSMNETQFEALQRDSRSMESSTGRINGSPEDGSGATGGEGQMLAERSSTTEITRAGVQVDPKKRKRQFANRTKTGCQTCRRRKKKCDEGKPECTNCMRGGFICEGYAHKATWTKPSLSKGHVPLQAKDRFSEPSSLYHSHSHSRESYVDPHATSQLDGARTRPIVVEEHDRPVARAPWGNGWTESSHRPYSSDHASAPEYSQAPPMAARPRPHPSEYEHSSSSSMSQRPPAPPTYSQNVQSMNSSHSAMTAQLALQHQSQAVHTSQGPPPPHAAPPPTVKPPKSEKEKMLTGEPYKAFSPQLVDEREQCKASLYHFNNSSNPGGGISREERARLFRAVLEAPWVRTLRNPHNPIGSLGKDVYVEAPFTCQYGYNIIIGDEVVIGSNCTILDPCRIVIGKRTTIGPNVNILGNSVSTNPKSRKGSQGFNIGGEIIIEEDVFIGGGVTILQGVRIGAGAVVGAGSLVNSDIPTFTMAAGNPARIKRGIWAEQRN
ncbi:trimeric LpxA-like protein [Lepidopterella palustris CBS 459.81]|uniref:Trimeric LpxA-like protein n=1 Tax=Lepidopterella palustris CBS 459.81 TaxID=1314670 RepID=A0A8E2JG94_9PEZI|nr:trimeric LpxA-like protein [Lepidopterella palustris CBS 459.81]